MSASPLQFTLEQMAEMLEALASRLSYIGEEDQRGIWRLYEAARILREGEDS